jgi:hypothetical protein
MYGATVNSLYWKALPLKIVLFIALYPVVGPWAFLLAPLALVSLVLITSHVSTESGKPKGGLNAHGVWKKSLDPPDARFGNYYDVDPDEDDQGRPYDRNGRVVKHSKPSRVERDTKWRDRHEYRPDPDNPGRNILFEIKTGLPARRWDSDQKIYVEEHTGLPARNQAEGFWEQWRIFFRGRP